VRDDLMAAEVEVDPFGRTAAFRTAEQAAVEGAGGGEVVDGEGDVEGREVRMHGGIQFRPADTNPAPVN
jgi:hypothetical protein